MTEIFCLLVAVDHVASENEQAIIRFAKEKFQKISNTYKTICTAGNMQ